MCTHPYVLYVVRVTRASVPVGVRPAVALFSILQNGIPYTIPCLKERFGNLTCVCPAFQLHLWGWGCAAPSSLTSSDSILLMSLCALYCLTPRARCALPSSPFLGQQWLGRPGMRKGSEGEPEDAMVSQAQRAVVRAKPWYCLPPNISEWQNMPSLEPQLST